ncbi:MAG: hypothetical protein HY879_06965 [Deltaproteobacteria bacterium]|nr:hypothetical protein [Deltaproteobacteria bacterium]
MKYQLLFSKDLAYLPEDEYKELADTGERVSMMLKKLYKSLK